MAGSPAGKIEGKRLGKAESDVGHQRPCSMVLSTTGWMRASGGVGERTEERMERRLERSSVFPMC